MNVLVTGAAGFIGKHLVSGLRTLGEVITLDIQEGVDLQMDIRNGDALNNLVTEGIDACVHLAAIAAPDRCKNDPTLGWETNVRGTHNVLRLCERLKIPRVVFFSSSHVYGISPLYLPTDESAPLQLHDAYTTTKILGERLVHLFWENHGIAYCTIRLFNSYGPGQSDQYFVGRKLAQAKAGGPVTIRNGSLTKDWVWVGDVVRAAILALESDFVGPVNVGTGVETRLDAIATQIAISYKVDMVEEPSDGTGPTRMCANWSCAKRLGWESKVSVEEGIRLLCEENR